MPSGDVYSVQHEQSSPGANPVIEITAGDFPLEIQRVTVSQADVATAAQTSVILQLLTAASSGGTSYTPRVLSPGAAASSATAKYAMTSTGTESDIYIRQGFNILAGFFYYPTEDERIVVARSGIFAIRFPAAPTAAKYTTTVVFKEL